MKVKVESISKLKDKFEISSKEYWNRFQDLEGKNEQLIKKNKEQVDKIKKLEVFIKDKYPGQFDSGNCKQGVSLDALYFSITDPKERENQKLPPERYLGYMNVNLKPTKIISATNKQQNTKFPAATKEVQNTKTDSQVKFYLIFYSYISSIKIRSIVCLPNLIISMEFLIMNLTSQITH